MSAIKPGKVRKMMLSSVVGFFAGMIGMVAFFELGAVPDWGGGQIAAGAVGVVYLATGVFTLMGAALPGLGAKLLNVSDVEELLEQRAILAGSALSIIAFGVMLLCLAGAGPGGFVRDEAVIAAVAFAFASSIVIYHRQWRLYDELWRQLSWESSAFAMTLTFPVLLIWAGAVQLGYIASLDPLAVIAFTAAAILVGAGIATGRRGLLAPR